HQSPTDDDHQRDHAEKSGEQQRLRRRLSRRQQNGGERARTRNEGEGQRKHRDILAFLRLLLFGSRRSGARGPGEHHVERNQEQQRAPLDTEGTQGDPHDGQEFRTHQGEQHAYGQRNDRRLAGHLFLVAFARALGETGEQRDQRNRIDDDEKYHEEFDELFDHGACCCAQKLHIARNTHWELNGIEAVPTSSSKWSPSTTKTRPLKSNTSTVPSPKWNTIPGMTSSWTSSSTRPTLRRTGRGRWTWKPKTWTANSRITHAACGPSPATVRCAADPRCTAAPLQRRPPLHHLAFGEFLDAPAENNQQNEPWRRAQARDDEEIRPADCGDHQPCDRSHDDSR